MPKRHRSKEELIEFFNSAVGVLQTLVIALGAGLDFWKFQLVARYSWNFGNLMKTVDALEDGNLKDKYGVYKGIKNGNFGGLTVTLGYFF